MKEELRKIIMNYGADVCGFAGVDRFGDAPKGFHPCDIYDECKTVIVFGVSLPKGLYMVEPRLIYGHFNDLVYPQVDKIALNLAKLLEIKYEGMGVPIPCNGPYEYWDEEKLEGRGLISIKHAAINAGIGALGKNTLLLNRTYGNRLVIGSVLTNLEIESDSYAQNICLEKCNLCIENCPIGALNGETVTQKECRINTYNTTKRGFDTVDCNKCRTVCPMRFGSNIE